MSEHVLFETEQIVEMIQTFINEENTIFVVGCVAWFTHPSILHALANSIRGASIIITKTSLTSGLLQMYSDISPLPGHSFAFREYGRGSGPSASLMHHKFLIGLDHNMHPLWCVNGSFNMTTHAVINIENCMCHLHPTTLDKFMKEYYRVFNLSTLLSLKFKTKRIKTRKSRKAKKCNTTKKGKTCIKKHHKTTSNAREISPGLVMLGFPSSCMRPL